MKRLRKNPSSRLTKDAENLIQLANDATQAGGRVESRFWDIALETVATQLLVAGNDAAIEAALDETYKQNPDAHDLLAESVETSAESCLFDVDGVNYQAQLISVPLIAWSKYEIASGKLQSADIAMIETHLRDYVLANDVRLSVDAYLYSIDQLPQSFSATRLHMQLLADAAVNEDPPIPRGPKKYETIDMPADTRMLLGVAVARYGHPIFRWQADAFNNLNSRISKTDKAKKATSKAVTKKTTTANSSRSDCLTNWVEHAKPVLAKLIPGASFECGLPDGFFRNCRECDKRVRPHMVRGAVSHLEVALNTAPGQLHAIIAGVGETQIDEYRVAFALKSSGEVVNGMIWPLINQEDDDTNPGPREEIEAILKAANVGTITKLPGMLSPEFCDDCGAPLFYDAQAEAVHPHMPDDSNQAPAHYH